MANHRRIQLLRQQLQEAEEAAAREMMEPESNYGSSNAFNNHGGGAQNFSGAKINAGANAGDRNQYRNAYSYGGRTVNNHGNTFSGNGNGGFIEGGFHAPTTNYNHK